MFLRKNLLKISSFGAIAIAVAVSLTSCGSPLSFESSVQLVVSDNTSTLADESFSQSSFNGIRDFFSSTIKADVPVASSQSIKENNGIWKKPGNDTISRIASYRYAFEYGTRVVVATGYNQQEALQQVTSDNPYYKEFKNSFRNSAFVFVDGAMSKGSGTDAGDYAKFDSNPYNVSSISYRADDGSFLAGISTAIFLNKYQNYFEKTKEGTLGVSSFVGLALPSTLNYLNGFRLGIHYWNTIMQPLIKTIDGKTSTLQVSWVSPTDSYDITNFVSGSFSANDTTASTLTENMAKNKASAIFPIAGPQTSLVVNRIASKGYKTIVLGVDTAQENTSSLEEDLPNGSDVGSGKIIQFSSIKNLKDSTNYILQAITSGKNGEDANDVNGYYGLGWNNVGTLTNAGVGVSDAGLPYLLNPNWNQWKINSKPITDFSNLKLTDLLKENVATELKSSDPVIQQYNDLLDSKFNTKTEETTLVDGDVSITKTSSDSSNDLNSKAIKIIEEKAKENNSLNGPTNSGDWKIQNDASGSNNCISKALSKFLPAIKANGIDTDYEVQDPNPQYIAKTKKTPDSLNQSVKNVFFRKV